MSRLFISYASVDRGEAVVLRDWLETKGWQDDIFLDVDPEHGISGGKKWREALRNAAERCEAVILLLSQPWLQSRVCWSEFQLAEKQHKPIIPIIIDHALPPIAQLPPELTAYQLIDRINATQVEFELRLQRALEDAGAGPENFSVPEGATPYGGLRPLTEKDAALFFGRDAEVIAALDTLREIRETGRKRIMVILGASGAGKSSLLRAGVWARLNRNDRQFLALPVLRPGDAALTGATGLWQLLADACSDGRRKPHLPGNAPRTRAAIAAAAEKDPAALAELIQLLKVAARGGLATATDLPPSPVLCIDQGEELLNTEHGVESDGFLAFLRAIHDADDQFLTVIAVRSDVYPQLQQDPRFDTESLRPFNLSPMSPVNLASVITGPARRMGLHIEPALQQALLRDAKGADALPLLAFTLERLYNERLDGDRLTLRDFMRLGGLAGAISLAAAELRRKAITRGIDEKALDPLLRRVFLPHLVRVNESGAFARRIAQLSEFDPACVPLIDLLIEQRLLVSDVRDGRPVYEIAHEAILREWPLLAGWVEAERGFLEWREQLAAARRLNEVGQADLLSGRALSLAQSFLELRRGDLSQADVGFVERSLAAEDARRAADEEQRERQRQAELEAARAREEAALASAKAEKDVAAQAVQSALRTRWLAGAMTLLAALALGVGFIAWRSRQDATDRASEALYAQQRDNSRRLAAIARDLRTRSGDEKALAIAWLALWSDGSPTEAAITDETTSEIYARSIQPVVRIEDHLAFVLSEDGRYAFSQLAGQESRLWRTDTFETLQTFPAGLEQTDDDVVPTVAPRFAADGNSLGVLSPGTLKYQIYDIDKRTFRTDITLPNPRQFGMDRYLDAAIAPDLAHLLLVTADGTARLFDAGTGVVMDTLPHPGPEREGDGDGNSHDGLSGVVFGPSGRHVVVTWYQFKSHYSYIWDLVSRHFLNVLDINALSGPLAFDPSERFLYVGHTENYIMNIARGDGERRRLSFMDDHRGFTPDYKFFRPGDVSPPRVLHDYARVFEATRKVESEDESDEGNAEREGTVTYPAMWFLDPVKISQRIGVPLGNYTATANGRAVGLFNSNDSCALGYLDLASSRLLGSIPVYTDAECDSSFADAVEVSPDGRLAFTLTGGENGQGSRPVLNVYRLSPETPDVARTAAISVGIVSGAGALVLADAAASRLEARNHAGELSWSASLSLPQQTSAVAASPDGRLLAAGDWAGNVRLGASDGAESGALPPHEAAISALAFSPRGDRIATAAHDAVVRVSDVTSREPIATLERHTAAISMVSFSRDGERLATASFDGSVRVWDRDLHEVASLPHYGAVFSARFSPDGSLLATGSEDGMVRIWSLSDPATPAMAEGHTGVVRDAVWSPDGMLLLSWSDDRTARLWHPSGAAVATLNGHAAELTHGAFAPNMKVIATGDRSGQVRLWDVKTGALLATRQAGSTPLAALEFLDEGRVLTAASQAGSLYTWPVAPGGLEERLAEVGDIVRTLRPLTTEECAQFHVNDLPGAEKVCGDPPVTPSPDT